MKKRYTKGLWITKFIKAIAICCFFSPCCIVAQTQKIDSLKKQLALETTPLQKVETIFELCDQSFSMHPDSFLLHINEAKKIISSLNNANLLIRLKYYEVIYFTRLSRPDTAFAIMESQLPLIDKKNNFILRNKFLLARARLLIITNKQKEALQESINLLQEAEKDGDHRMQLITPIQIGWAYMELGQNDEALSWFYSAKAKYEKEGSVEKSFAACYSNIAAIYSDQHKLDSAEFFIEKAIHIAKKEQHLAGLANCYYIYSDICVANNDNIKAEGFLQQGLQIRKLIGDVFYIVSDLTQLAIFYAKNNQTDKGIAIIKEGIALAQKNNLDAKLPILYNALAQNYRAANDYKNYAATLNKVIELKDSLYQRNKAEALQEIQIKYDVQKKETVIAQQKLSLFQRKLFLYGAAIIAIVLSVFFALRFKKYQQKQKIFAEQKRIQNEVAVKDAEEKERKRIAAELHDNLGVQANAILHNSSLLQKENENNKSVVTDLQETAKEMMLNLRETLWAMKSNDILAMDVWLRVISFCQQMGRHYKHISISTEGEPPAEKMLTSPNALNVVMIIQEAINNAIKYSDTLQIIVKSEVQNNKWQIYIEDYGKGFELDKAATKQDSYGLHNMKERASNSNFSYDIVTKIGKGTTIKIGIAI